MTYLKVALASAAALALAAPAMADHHGKKMDHDKTKTTVTMEERTDVMGATEMMDPVKINDTVGEVLQADGEPSIQSDQEIIVDKGQMTEAGFRMADDDGMVADNAIVVPGSAGTLSTVTCPPGTEAQLDMTCLITGDYMPVED